MINLKKENTTQKQIAIAHSNYGLAAGINVYLEQGYTFVTEFPDVRPLHNETYSRPEHIIIYQLPTNDAKSTK